MAIQWGEGIEKDTVAQPEITVRSEFEGHVQISEGITKDREHGSKWGWGYGQ